MSFPEVLKPRLALLLSFALFFAVAKGADIHADAYPFSTCPLSGEKLTSMGEPVKKLFEGREIRFCCKGCVAIFEKNPKKYLEKIDKAIVQAQLPFYPLDTCLVSGMKLGSMGEPVNLVYKNRLVRFCCKGCVSRFKKDPSKFIRKLNQEVVKKQKKLYPLKKCIVSGMPLNSMGKAVQFVHGNRLYLFCCKGCMSKFKKDPSSYIGKVWKVYTCPVHPKIRQIKPGRCPICSMRLVPEKGKQK